MKTNSTAAITLMLATVASALALSFSDKHGASASDEQADSGGYRSPAGLAISPDGQTLYVSDYTADCVYIMDLASKKLRAEVKMDGGPRGLSLSDDGRRLYVAQRKAGSVAVVDTQQSEVTEKIPVGRWPSTVLAVSDTLYVCNQDRHSVSVVDLAPSPARQVKEIPVVREPISLAATSDGRSIVVANFLAHGILTEPGLSAEITIIDGSDQEVRSRVKLPPGSTLVNSVCVSPDDKWAYVVHQLSRFSLPVTQLERGWVNTYALSVIDIQQGKRLATMLLDDLYQGAANPSAVVCSRDGNTLWIAHAGVHEVSVINVGLVHALFGGQVPEELAGLKDGTRPNIWVRIQDDPALIEELANDLTALYIAGAIRRLSSGGNGPRALVLSPDEKQLFVANYYSGSVAIIDPASGDDLGELKLGSQPELDAARRGEIIFHDALHAFQRWHSCASCHPNDGRADGLRWDFLRDGIGNPKDTPSLVYVHETEPLNRLALREDAREGARTGMLVSHMIVPTEEQVEDLLAYMVSLRPEPNPNLTNDGALSETAQRGKLVFEGKAGCARCHPAPFFTDKTSYDIGTRTATDPTGSYDTPTLLEAFRTAPYLHDGRALTIRDVITKHNPDDAHGHVKGLSEQEIEDLVQYVLSL